MNQKPQRPGRKNLLAFALAAILLAVAVCSFIWWPQLSQLAATLIQRGAKTSVEKVDEGPEKESSESHPGHAAAASIELSAQARSNLGITAETIRPVALTTYRRTLNVPAVVVARPGRTEIQVSTPLNGVIVHVHAVTGEAVVPGQLLFEVKLSYEDLVESQTAYLKSLGELAVENREIERLETATQSGAISGKTLLERRYAKDKLEALIRSQKEGLKLHGLSDRQVDAIATEGKLLRDLEIVAPNIDAHGSQEEMRLSQMELHSVAFRSATQVGGTENLRTEGNASGINPPPTPLIIEQLNAQKGQAITAGEQLCSLADYQLLYVEGQAFEQDGPAIAKAAQRGWKVTAAFQGRDTEDVVDNLKIVFVGNAVDVSSRTLSFFVELPNTILRDEVSPQKQRYVSWKFRTGQRLEVRVPIEEWKNQIVLPVDAVVKEGADWFVFQQNGKHFDRVPVQVTYRDQSSVVIANDGSLYPGDMVVLTAAYQLQMAIKNKSGGAVDPHAGHSH